MTCKGKTAGPGKSIPGFHNIPDSINAVVGGLTGTVADIQTWQDGNVLLLAETTGTPGMDLEINFTDVKSIRRVALGMFYDGSALHWVEIQLWDYVAVAYKTVWTFSAGNGLNYRYSDLPVSGTNFIDGSGNSKMRIVHPPSGNAAHDAHIDYAALIT